MTALFAFAHAGGVTIASDSRVSDEAVHWDEPEPKYWVHDRLVVGAAGGARATVIAQAIPPLRAQRASESDVVYLTTVAGEAIRQALRATDTPAPDFAALLVWRGRVFVLDTDFAVSAPSRGYAAVGSAEHVALGALGYSFRRDPDLPPRDRALEVLALCGEMCAGVGGEPHVLTVTERKPPAPPRKPRAKR